MSRPSGRAGRLVSRSPKAGYQPGIIASVGQTATQAPQSVHFAGSIQRTSFFSLIASTGHSGSHAAQLMQASVTLWAIEVPLLCAVFRHYSTEAIGQASTEAPRRRTAAAQKPRLSGGPIRLSLALREANRLIYTQ